MFVAMRVLILLLLSSCTFFSCKKNSAPFVLEGSYQSTSLITLELPEMFTAAGEVQNQGLISDFIQRHLSGGSAQITWFSSNSMPFEDTITLSIQSNSGQMKWVEQGPFSPMVRISPIHLTSVGENEIKVAVLDTQSVSISSLGSLCVTLNSQLQKYEPQVFDCVTFGTTSLCKQFITLPVVRQNGEVRVPVLHALSSKNSSCSSARIWFNLLNEATLNILDVGDTIIIQKGYCRLQKL
jgi:hypothetical protein